MRAARGPAAIARGVVMQERTFIGLDVHARSVEAGLLDGLAAAFVQRAVHRPTSAPEGA